MKAPTVDRLLEFVTHDVNIVIGKAIKRLRELGDEELAEELYGINTSISLLNVTGVDRGKQDDNK